jgi:hypothetical protein
MREQAPLNLEEIIEGPGQAGEWTTKGLHGREMLVFSGGIDTMVSANLRTGDRRKLTLRAVLYVCVVCKQTIAA